jgi:hypothetical protein
MFMRLTQEEIDDTLSVISVSNSVEYAELVENERLQVADVVTATAAAALTKSIANVATDERFWDTGPDMSTLAIEERAQVGCQERNRKKEKKLLLPANTTESTRIRDRIDKSKSRKRQGDVERGILFSLVE